MTSTSRSPRAPATHDGFAVASLVLGLCWLGGVGAVLAICFSCASLGRSSRENQSPSGMAIGGLVLGGLGLIGAAILLGILLVGHHVDPTQQWLNCLQSNIDNGTDNYCPSPPAP